MISEEKMSKIKVKPVGENILVKRREAETVTKSGIVLPESAKEKPKEGEVIALGQGRMLKNGNFVDFQVKVGDRVLFSSYAGSEFKIDGQELLIMGEEDILAILT